jgi:hypothetical protein
MGIWRCKWEDSQDGHFCSCHDYPASPHYTTRSWAMVLYGNSARQDFGDIMNEGTCIVPTHSRHRFLPFHLQQRHYSYCRSSAVFLRALPPLLRPASYLSLIVMTSRPRSPCLSIRSGTADIESIAALGRRPACRCRGVCTGTPTADIVDPASFSFASSTRESRTVNSPL